MKKRIVVLGAGQVGHAIAIDLKRSGFDVTAADRDETVLGELNSLYGIRSVKADFGDGSVGRLVGDYDLVAGAAPGGMGYRIMEQVIGAGKDMVDISFCPEDFMALDGPARERGVTLVPDMGVAPGLCNAILGYHNARMEVRSYRCYVGGLPFEREWPLEYKSSWSLMDCIEEYVRPARLRRNGRLLVLPAMSEVETLEFERIGKLEAWNSDGLRSLLDSFPRIPDMVEKTLRYPGTVEYLRVLRDLGYFSGREVEAGGTRIRPVDLTAALLYPRFKLEKGEGEFTVMRVVIEGEKGGTPVRYRYDLYDAYDQETGTTSMARTTGYTCTGIAALLLGGKLRGPGVIPPERSVVDETGFRFLLDHLEERGVAFRVTSEEGARTQ